MLMFMSCDGKKVALLVLRRVGIVRRGKTKCAACGLAKIVFKNMRWKKNKKHRVGQRVGLDAVRL